MASKPKFKLTKQHIRSIQEVFNLIDDDCDGKIDKNQFGVLYRVLGQTITEEELQALSNFKDKAASASEGSNYEGRRGSDQSSQSAASSHASRSVTSSKGPGSVRRMHSKSLQRIPSFSTQNKEEVKINLEEFLNVFTDNFQQPTSKAVLLQAFRTFDPNCTGYLSTQVFQDLVTGGKEPLTRDEVEYILKLAGAPKGGKFDYTVLCERLIEGPQGVRSVY